MEIRRLFGALPDAIVAQSLAVLHAAVLHRIRNMNEQSGEEIALGCFRVDERGKIVEHWGSIQRSPETTANGHRMC